MSECVCFSLKETSYDHIAALVFKECLFNFRERLSFYIGMSSLFFWILCQLPQIIENYKNQSAHALANLLLVQWLFGDTLNLIGSLLTHQLAFQRLSAAVFVLLDISMILQKFYYYGKSKRLAPVSFSSSAAQRIVFVAVAMISVAPSDISATSLEPITLNMMQSCESRPEISNQRLVLGYVLGCISSCFYIGSRIAQITKIHRERTVQGITYGMFIFAVLGNFSYYTGILLRNNHITKAIPWLIGSISCFLLDCYILTLIHRYRKYDALKTITNTLLSDDENARSSF